MRDVVIENPILNSPYEMPARHFRFDDEGITNEIIDERRASAYFVPIAQSKKKGKQLDFSEWTEDRIEENKLVNRIRARVDKWRAGGYVGVTRTTKELLEWWSNPERENKLFFCQREAVETAIYITEVANKYGDAWIENDLREFNAEANPELFRIALKMATGTGKTVVMAMLIAWQALNKLADKQNSRFSDAFLIVTPGITIKDRLRVLLPTDPDNYYRERDLLPPGMAQELNKAKIVITNYHGFKLRKREAASKLTEAILTESGKKKSPFEETPAQMVRRVCRELGNKKNIIVINDEAHHCYRQREDGIKYALKGEERKEAEGREEAARVWISGIEAIKKKLGVKVVYDLSATPFFLRGSGYPEGTLFRWVVSDFSLIDAIEAGLVKVPRVPVSDDAMVGAMPKYRNLWPLIKDNLPKKGRGAKAETGEPKPPKELQGALLTLYENYEKYFKNWQGQQDASDRDVAPPVFIVVCNNTNVSKLVYEWISGWEKPLKDDDSTLVEGNLSLFNNVKDGKWLPKPNTILIDSEQLESGEAMKPEFKKAAAAEIDAFKTEYRQRYPDRDVDNLTDQDLLREVMNTVGKPGRLGEHVRCVVSVSMLTEGWDANTVTHILGVRAFGTQLLCEQVVGRGLRRRSYALNEDGKFNPEYAEVYGVPFSFIPCSGSQKKPVIDFKTTRVKALPERSACEIRFPRVQGYRYAVQESTLQHKFTDRSVVTLSTQDVPSMVENAPIVGETAIHTLDDLKNRREQEVIFLIAKLVLEKYYRQDQRMIDQAAADKENHRFDSEVQAWYFPQILKITRQWLSECVKLKDDTFPQMLLLLDYAHEAADCIHKAIVRASGGESRLLPVLPAYDVEGTTRHVDFDTRKDVWPTNPDKCPVTHVVCDTRDWEQKIAQQLESMEEIVHYVKNDHLGFEIPYTIEGNNKKYLPDFLCHVGDGGDDYLNLIVECSGAAKKDKAIKVETAKTLWMPAVNNHGGLGRWAFVEVTDPWDTKNVIRDFLVELKSAEAA